MHIHSQDIPNESTLDNLTNQPYDENKGLVNGRSITNLNASEPEHFSHIAHLVDDIAMPNFIKISNPNENFDKQFMITDLVNNKSIVSKKQTIDNSMFYKSSTHEAFLELDQIFTQGKAAPEQIIVIENGEAKQLSQVVNINYLNSNTEGFLVTEDKNGNPTLHFESEEKAKEFIEKHSHIFYKGETKTFKIAVLPREYRSKLASILKKSVKNYIAYRLDQATKKFKEEEDPAVQALPAYVTSRYIPTADHFPSLNIEIKPLFFSNRMFMQTMQTAEKILKARKEEEQRRADDNKKDDIKRTEIKRQIRKEENTKEDIRLMEVRHSHVKGEVNATEKTHSIPPMP